MTPSEFYEKYWEIKDKNGNFLPALKLSKAEKDFFDLAAKENYNIVYFYRKRARSVVIDCDLIKELMQEQGNKNEKNFST